MGQLGKALQLYEQNFKRYPGYVESIGNNPDMATQQLRGSWVVAVFPFMEEQSAYDSWKDQHLPVAPSIAVLNCASDPPEITGAPTLSYVVNAGRSPGDNTQPRQPQIMENQADGMFFDRSCPPLNAQRGAPQPKDARQIGNSCAMLEMSSRYLDSHDGNSKTMMISENIHATFYLYFNAVTGEYDHDNRIRDDKQYFGFVWSNRPQSIERINGDNDQSFATMDQLSAVYSYAWPSSQHPGYVNRVFADGHVNQMLETIDPAVYRQLMTTRDKASDNVTKGMLVNDESF
jgi:prepilin-type processing-associated H-X9-DG protein